MKYYSGADYLFWALAAVMTLGPLAMAPAYGDGAMMKSSMSSAAPAKQQASPNPKIAPNDKQESAAP